MASWACSGAWISMYNQQGVLFGMGMVLASIPIATLTDVIEVKESYARMQIGSRDLFLRWICCGTFVLSATTISYAVFLDK